MLDAQLAHRAADAGIALAAKGAGSDWMERATDLLSEFIRRHRGQHFMTEDVRVWAEKKGLPRPPDSRSWGAVIRYARRAGDIRIIGYGRQRSVSCHGSPKAIWEAL
jgi:hypothetical protein